MVTGIGVSLLLATAAPVGAPAQTVVVPLAVDRAVARVRPVAMFAAPVDSPDLRRLTEPVNPSQMIRLRPAALSYAVADVPPPAEELRVASLVASDREAQLTGRKVRRSGMAAGLSFRMTAADGVLAPEVGMSGPVGKALTRIALEAAEPE